jgi:hypothetical protein
MERREIAESALKHLCGRIGVGYTTETEPIDGFWFLATEGRNKVSIEQWSENARTGGHGVAIPLGNYGQNLTHEEAYDRLWFADRILTARSEALTHAKARR